jgi:hypothetical protein
MIEIAPNRFVVKKRIVAANIYVKDNVTKVAISLDTVNKEEQTVFSGQMANEQEARNFVSNLAD